MLFLLLFYLFIFIICLFILNRYEFGNDFSTQTNRNLYDYVIDKYNKIDSIDFFDIYSNKVLLEDE